MRITGGRAFVQGAHVPRKQLQVMTFRGECVITRRILSTALVAEILRSEASVLAGSLSRKNTIQSLNTRKLVNVNKILMRS